MSRIKNSTLLSLAVASALGQVATSAMAQQLEEVIVTARKTEESLQTAPVAVSAFTAKAIEEQGLRSINDLARYTPGLSFSQAFGRSTDRPVVRGQSNVLAGVQFGVESGTAYFIDGVYFPGDIQGIDMNALQRVEVVKGPQSALYGRNTYAGAINFVTRPPTEDLEANVKASFEDYQSHDYSFSVGSSFFNDSFGARVFARDHKYGGQYENSLTGKKVGDESTKSLGLSLTWHPFDDFKASSNLFYREDRDGPLALFLTSANDNNCMPGYRSTYYRNPPGPATRGTNPNQYYCGVIAPGTVALNTDPLLVTDTLGSTMMRDGTAFDGVDTKEAFGSLRLDWDIAGSGWVVTSLSGLRDYKNRFGTDSDHSNAFTLLPNFNPGIPAVSPFFGQAIPAPGSPSEKEPLFANTNRDDVNSLSTELRLASPQDRRLRGMVGYYYYDYKDKGYDLTFAQPVKGPQSYEETVKDNAVFGLVAFDITPSLTLTAEARYMEEKKTRDEFCSSDTGDYNYWTFTCTNRSFSITPTSPNYYNRPLGTPLYGDEVKFTSTTPRVTLDWQATPDTMFYGVFSQGAKPGGLNGAAGLLVEKPEYKQETSNNFEVGTKMTMADNRVRVNIAAYFTDAKDVQFTQALPTGGGNAVTSIATNQGEGQIYGVEFETQAALTDALTVSAGYSYVHTEITKGCDDFEYTLNTGGLVYNPSLGNVKECDISGNRYPLAPEQNGSLVFNYDAPMKAREGLNLVSNFGVSYEGSKYVQVHNLAQTGETTLVNLRFGVRSDNGWSIIAYGKNLTDVETIPMATRWFDLRTGSAYSTPPGCTPAALVPCGPAATPPGTGPTPTGYPVTGAPGQRGGADTGSPRAFFGALRPGRTFGIEFRYDFKL
jgi:outer membrane receptor protein involved in Fe transport